MIQGILPSELARDCLYHISQGCCDFTRRNHAGIWSQPNHQDRECVAKVHRSAELHREAVLKGTHSRKCSEQIFPDLSVKLGIARLCLPNLLAKASHNNLAINQIPHQQEGKPAESEERYFQGSTAEQHWMALNCGVHQNCDSRNKNANNGQRKDSQMKFARVHTHRIHAIKKPHAVPLFVSTQPSVSIEKAPSPRSPKR